MRNLSNIFRSILAFSLVLGAVFMPFLAVAQSSDTQNSQTKDLSLQSNTSLMSILQDSKVKQSSSSTDKNNQIAQLDPNTDVNIVSDNAILPATSSLGAGADANVDPGSDQTSIYVVHKGDTIAQIAQMFGVSPNTILLANDLKKGAKLSEGDVLLILPISGVEHTVTKGQTLQSIANIYKVDVSDIAVYNGLAQDAKLAIGDKIMIPGADTMSNEGGDKPVKNLGSSVVNDKNYYDSHPLQNLIGYFINPVPNGIKTQGLHGPGHRGIDIGAPTGSNIYASASGTVIATKSGCKVGQTHCGGGYGNMAIIQHPNGTKTLYGHMSKLIAQSGDEVTQGQIIGLVGTTGYSTGPHLHFEVFNAKNPGSDWSWANN